MRKRPTILVVTLTEAKNLARRVDILTRQLAAAKRKQTKERQRQWKKAYRLGHRRSKESAWEANFKLAIEHRRWLQVATKDWNYWLQQAKHYLMEAKLDRMFTDPSSSLP